MRDGERLDFNQKEKLDKNYHKALLASFHADIFIIWVETVIYPFLFSAFEINIIKNRRSCLCQNFRNSQNWKDFF